MALGGVSSIVEECVRESSCELMLILFRFRRAFDARPTCAHRPEALGVLRLMDAKRSSDSFALRARFVAVPYK